MQLTEVLISNYRNLNGVHLRLHPKVAFIIGENELGKSNFLDLLDILFNQKSFSEDDFRDSASPIEVEFTLVLSAAEQGAFEDLFNPRSSEEVSFLASQEYSNIGDWIGFQWINGRDKAIEIPSRLFRRVNYIHYDSLRAPSRELTFHRGTGASSFLSYLIEQYISRENQTQAYLIQDSVDSLVEYIDQVLQWIKPFRTQEVSVFTDAENRVDLLSRILRLKGADDFGIEKSGYGVQFSMLVILSVLQKLMKLRQSPTWQQSVFVESRSHFTKQEYEDFVTGCPGVASQIGDYVRREQDRVYVDTDEMPSELRCELGIGNLRQISQRRITSLILGLDEPQIHLHPYKQRSLVKYIAALLDNEDEDFNVLLRRLFGVDAVSGQAIIVTHSPNVLLDDYRQVVRFYRSGGAIGAISGHSVDIDPQMHKHLLMNLPYIQEAFFCRCVIVVEGQTETGAFPRWIDETIGDPDELGIVVINAGGIHSVPPVVKLLNEFEIPTVAIIDRDAYDKNRHGAIEGIRVTKHLDFEEELFEAVFARDEKLTFLFEVLEEYGSAGLDRYVDHRRLSTTASKYGIDVTWDTTDRGDRIVFSDLDDDADRNLLKAMFLSWLTLSHLKTVSFGRFLGTKARSDIIPTVYRKAMEEAGRLARLGNEQPE